MPVVLLTSNLVSYLILYIDDLVLSFFLHLPPSLQYIAMSPTATQSTIQKALMSGKETHTHTHQAVYEYIHEIMKQQNTIINITKDVDLIADNDQMLVNGLH